MERLVIYCSKTGFTKSYADWLSEEIPCKTVSVEEAESMDLKKYNLVIFASSMYAGSIKKINWFKEKSEGIDNRILLVTGAAPFDYQTFPKEAEEFRMFYLQSGLRYDKMGIKDRMMMKALLLFLRSKKDKNEEETALTQVISESHDNSSKENLLPVIQYIKDNDL